MTENENPDFTVVDRRQAAQTEDVPQSDAPTESAPDALKPDVTGEAPATAGEPDAETGADPYGMPDPAMLIAFAAMQTTPQELLGLLAPAFDSMARRALGLIADTATGELTQDLDTAKTAIDAVQFCLSKAEATLASAEYREMMRRLNDLRLTYVSKLQSS